MNESFDKEKKRASLTIQIRDIADNSAFGQTVSATIVINNGEKTISKNITSNDTIEIVKDIDSTITATISVSLDLSTYSQCDESGVLEGSKTITFSQDVATTSVYMKSTTVSIPAIEGKLRHADNDPLGTEIDDNQVLLLCFDNDGVFELLEDSSARTVTYPDGNGANGASISHGQFSNLGSGIEFTDVTYSGTYATIDLAIVLDSNSNNSIDIGETYYPFSVTLMKELLII